MRDIPACKWLDQWTELAQKYEPSPVSHSAFTKNNVNVLTGNLCVCVCF